MRKNPLMKKSWAIGIILVFVGTGFIPAIAQDTKKPFPTSRGNWLYVGGSGPGNYMKIQDAIDNASDGDTVFVYNDSAPYNEHLSIGKSINLIGEDRNSTVLDGDYYGCVLVITSYHKVVISGFTIQNSGNYTSPYGWADAGVSLWGVSTVIIGNNIQNNLCGILLYCSHDNNISGNVIQLNRLGIYFPPSLGYCERNNISGNIIQGNTKGICIQSPENNKIFHNNFINNTVYNAGDYFSDCWDGNYWDDYLGTDENHDGIGDEPYSIAGGSNEDQYPLMNPWINAPPSAPVITGLDCGKAKRMYNYTFNSTDPNGDSVYYCIDWGDSTMSGWIDLFPSGQEMFARHSWPKGNYIIRSKAKDIYGAESGWSTLTITMSRPMFFNPPSFIRFLEQFPHAFPILRYLLEFNQ
jgi:parallel beta-helix repeat protein